MDNKKWKEFINSKLDECGYSNDIESKEFEIQKENSPVIRIKFKNGQNAYGITREFEKDKLIWVTHKRNYYFGFQYSYTNEVSIRPKLNFNNKEWRTIK